MESNDVSLTFSDMFLETFYSSDMSTGYLEDAIADWTNKHKKDHQYSSYLHGHTIDCSNPKNCWCLDEQNPATPFLNECYPKFNGGMQFKTTEEGDMHGDNIKEDAYLSYTSCSMWQLSKESDKIDDTSSNSRYHSQRKKVVYPFELVKPGGVEGELTLRDINHKMLMRPTKPIPHPVEMSVEVRGRSTHQRASASGIGLSGKAVTAFAKIHTQGKGTITIIRTKD